MAKTIIGQNRDGSYIYGEDTTKKPVAPIAPVTNTSTGIPNVGTPRFDTLQYQKVIPGKEFTPVEKKEIQTTIDKQKTVKDVLNINKRIDSTSERTKQLREHFKYLQDKGELYLNDKQSDYIKRVKAKYPDYQDVPDTTLYGKMILADEKLMEKYGNIGEKTFLNNLATQPKRIGGAIIADIDRSRDIYDNALRDFGGTVNDPTPSVFDKFMAALPAVAGGAVNIPLNVAGEVLNTNPFLKPSNNTTSFTENLGNTFQENLTKITDFAGKAPEATADFISQYIPNEWKQDFKDAADRNPDIIPKVQTLLESGVELANVLPFLKIKGPAPAWVDELASKKWVGEDALQFVKDKTKQGATTTSEWVQTQTQNIGPRLEAKYATQNTTDWASPTKDLRRGNKTLDKIVNRQLEKDINSPQVLTDLGIKHDEHIIDGKYDTKATADDVKQSAIELSRNTLKPVLADMDIQAPRFTSLNDMRDAAIKKAKEAKPKDLADILEDIKKEFDDFREGGIREQYPNGFDRVGLHENKIKFSQGVYDATRPTKTTAGRYISDVLRKELEDIVPESLVPVRAFNRELEKMFAAARYLEELHAKGVSKSFLKKMTEKAAKGVGTLVGGAVGSVFGGAGTIPWAIAGYQTTSILQRMADNMSNPLKNYFLNKAETKIPGAISKVGEFQKGIDISGNPGVPLLEAPKFNSKTNVGRVPNDATLPGGEPVYLGKDSRNINTQNDINRTSIGDNNTQLGDFATPKEVTPVDTGAGKSLAISAENKTMGAKKLLEKFEQLSPEEKAKAKMASPRLAELVEINTEIKDIQEFKGDFGYTPPEVIEGIGKKYLTYSQEAKEMIRKGLDKEDLAELQKINRKEAGLPEPVVEGKVKVEKKPVDKKKKEVKANLPKTPQVEGKTVDPELLSLQKSQESLPGLPKVEVPADYVPKDGLPTGTEFEAPIISSISKTKGKLPSPDVKRPQIRGFDLSTRSSMLESLKEQGMFTDSFFVVKDKNVSNKLFEYAEKKAIKKGNPTSGTKVDMKALVERAENGADTLLTPKEYMKLGKENGVYLRMDIGNGNQVAVNASYADIFFKNFDDVTFKGNNELSPVVVLSKGEPVGVIMPIKDVYSLKGKLGDFSMQSKTPQVEGKTPKPKITDVYEKSGMTPEMASIARNLDESFGLDVSKSEYIDEYVSQKLGKKFRYSTDLAGRYTPEIETAIKEAKDIYTKFRAKPKQSLPMAQKESVKYSKPVEDTLIKEARKYKSAEEFVGSQGKEIYHGTTQKLDRFQPNNPTETIAGKAGTYFTSNRLEARGFGDNIVEARLSPSAKVKKIYDNGKPNQQIADELFQARREGYDAVEIVGRPLQRGNRERLKNARKEMVSVRKEVDRLADDFLSGKITQNQYESSRPYLRLQELINEEKPTHTVVFNTDKIKTKSQLTDIYNKAHSKSVPMAQKESVKYSEPLYKNGSEFEDAVKKQINRVFILNGRGLEDVSIIGSTARGKLKPNDLDILVTPKKKYGELKSEDLYDRIDLQNLIKDEIQSFFPNKKIHITIAEHDIKRGPKISISDLYNKK